jgi:hypothetical protein
MPGFDGTGPAGRGPMTGGARGPCRPLRRPYAARRVYGLPSALPAPPVRVGLGRPRRGLRRAAWRRGWRRVGGRGWWGRGAR